MASTHKHIRSSTVNKRPTTAIAEGQIALNTNATSPGLFFKDSTGATIIKIGPVHVGATAPNASPAAGGSSGNSTGEIWLDNSLTPVGVKIWNGSAWVNATPTGTTTVAGLLELATDAETQTGSDTARAVTPASLQSKLSDSTSTTSSITIASSTAVKSAYDLANAALPKSGGTVTGALEIGSSGSLVFEGSTADDFETTLAVTDPTADRTITLPDVNGTVVTTGDTGTVTSAMIADGTIVNADISASAEIAVSKLADGAARQVLQTDAAGTGVEWTDSIALPGSATATSFSPTGSSVPTNGFYLPTTNNVAISTNGSGRLFVDASGDVGVGTASPDPGGQGLHVHNASAADSSVRITNSTTGATNGDGFAIQVASDGTAKLRQFENVALTFETSGTERLRITSTGALNFVGAGTAGSTQAVSFNGSAPVNSLVIDSSGRVGLGTSSPSYVLDVDAGSSANALQLNSTNATFGVSANFKYSGTAIGGIGSAKGIDSTLALTDLGINSVSNLDLCTNYTQRVRIDSSGRVGIGTTSPVGPLTIQGPAGTNGINQGIGFLYSNGTSYGALGLNNSTGWPQLMARAGSGLTFHVNSDLLTTGEAARIDSSGRLLVGTSSNSYASTIVCEGNSSDSAGEAVVRLNRGTAIPTSGQGLGAIVFGQSGSADGAYISGVADADWSASNDYPTRLVFSTTADGASSPTERMRITNTGLHRHHSSEGVFRVNSSQGAGTTYELFWGGYGGSSTTTEGTNSIKIYTNGNIENTNNSYGSLSDVKLKENIVNASSQWDDLKALQIRNYNFKEGETHRQIGLIAQEVELVSPGLVSESPDRDEDGNDLGTVTKSVNYSVLYMKAVKALQEAMERIEVLEAKVNALEGN